MATDFRELQEQKAQKQAGQVRMSYMDSRLVDTTKLMKDLLTVDEIKQLQVIPLEKQDLHVLVAIHTKTPKSSMTFLKHKFPDYIFEYIMISMEGYKDMVLVYDPPIDPVYDDIELSKSSGKDDVHFQEISQKLEEVRSDDILNYLVKQATKLNASDIHTEAQEKGVRIRMRVDGALHPVAEVTHLKYRNIEAAIASKADITKEAGGAQTGHWTEVLEMEEGDVKHVNMRIETVPTVYGYDAVIRLFSVEHEMMYIDKLELQDHHKEVINDIVKNPHGMALVVGPTGSGKSTTLYSVLNKLNTPERKIITLEDPVEYAIEGITQIPVASRKGESFIEGLRAILRLDPDVVMIGEIRDGDTAKTALQASLTGHLVLSTFHANDAATAFTRMLDLIDYNPLLLGAIRLVAAQRLVRKLDPETRQEYEPDEHTKEMIRQVYDKIPEGYKKPDLENIKLYKPGTSEANPFGYKGRQVIMEQIVVDNELYKLILNKKEDTSTNDIMDVARKTGFISMKQDAISRALRGETSLEEVTKVIG